MTEVWTKERIEREYAAKRKLVADAMALAKAIKSNEYEVDVDILEQAPDALVVLADEVKRLTDQMDNWLEGH